jgi:uncharacterized protein YehS (DUF1456 family)
MNNNDVLRSLRYTFEFNDSKMIEIFQLGGIQTTREEISNWLNRDDDKEFVAIYDKDLAGFLNGFIIEKRGKKEGAEPVLEKSLSNNQVLRKLKIGLNLQDQNVLDMLEKAQFRLGKHELSAFFRKPTQAQYRDCKDQVLRNFLKGMQLTYRP